MTKAPRKNKKARRYYIGVKKTKNKKKRHHVPESNARLESNQFRYT